MFKTNTDWDYLLHDIVTSLSFYKLEQQIFEEEKNYVLYPSSKSRYAAFEKTPFSSVQVILCNDQPYSRPNMSDGLAFSSLYTRPRPLINIFRKIEDELKIIPYYDNYDLSRWAEQGVFLLNLTLTTRAYRADSHLKLDWNQLTYNAIKLLYNDERPKVFIFLSGTDSQLRYLLTNKNSNHLVLTGPSPEYRRFFYHDYFKETNNFLRTHYNTEIDWR